MPPRRSNRHASSRIGIKRPTEDPLTPPATQESQIPVPVPKKRGRPRKQPDSQQFRIAEDDTATQPSQRPSQHSVLREGPFLTNHREQFAWNERLGDFHKLDVPRREPKLHLPEDFNNNDSWPSPAAFFDLYFLNGCWKR
ncbi:hypothetical protein MPH_13823 [Macrophomina phaseolina MS6]|uniref:Uncharacterized protein n=1 Tax=Macrophomina phaseolina (strain MS6) TaxID=1126212 RepID=K2R8E4_MACPH|nr:hypothetical protein MPH_13823 [Macrophomina phaseolina MS6]